MSSSEAGQVSDLGAPKVFEEVDPYPSSLVKPSFQVQEAPPEQISKLNFPPSKLHHQKLALLPGQHWEDQIMSGNF